MARKPATQDTTESPKTSGAAEAAADKGRAQATERKNDSAVTTAAEGLAMGPEAATAAGGDGSTPPADPSGLAVRVVGPEGGFRRCGRGFGPEPVTIPLGELSEDEKAALIAEPALSVTTVPCETPAGGGK